MTRMIREKSARISRRTFVVSSAAGGLALGLRVPFDAAMAQGGETEVNAWVVIKPDDTAVIRIARAEMGQGTLTGLCQLVAEELECDWSKVVTEFPTPGQSLARKRVYGDKADCARHQESRGFPPDSPRPPLCPRPPRPR